MGLNDRNPSLFLTQTSVPNSPDFFGLNSFCKSHDTKFGPHQRSSIAYDFPSVILLVSRGPEQCPNGQQWRAFGEAVIIALPGQKLQVSMAVAFNRPSTDEVLPQILCFVARCDLFEVSADARQDNLTDHFQKARICLRFLQQLCF